MLLYDVTGGITAEIFRPLSLTVRETRRIRGFLCGDDDPLDLAAFPKIQILLAPTLKALFVVGVFRRSGDAGPRSPTLIFGLRVESIARRGSFSRLVIARGLLFLFVCNALYYCSWEGTGA